METGKKVRYQPMFDAEMAEKIRIEAEKTGAKPAPFIAKVVEKHISKQEVDVVSKKEYGNGK